MHFGFALRRLSACALWFARFVPLRARACLALFCRVRCDLLASYPFVLPPAWRLFCRLPSLFAAARFVPLHTCTCVVARFCRCLSAHLVCLFRATSWLLPAWWLGFCRLPACTLRSGSFRAVSCLYLFRGSVLAAYLSVVCGCAGFAPLRACACFVAGSWRLPACSLRSG